MGGEGILDETSPEYAQQLQLRKILLEESSNFAHPQFYIFTVIPVIVSILYICFTGLIKPASVVTCSGGWVGLFVVQLLIQFAMGVWAVQYMRGSYTRKVAAGYRFHETDTQFTLSNAIFLSAATFVGGFLSAFLGVGGATIYNPLLIALNKHPQVANATGMYIVLINALIT